jgi:hypothetical protein
MPQPALQTIQVLVAPVVMISANGLLALALYNRLAAVMNRVRAFHKESFDLAARINAAGGGQNGAEAALFARRIRTLDELGHRMFVRARLIRNALYCLLLSVLCMIGCSLALGLSALYEPFDWAALALFYLGAVCMMLGIAAALFELHRLLDPLLLEHDMLEKAHPEETSEG